MVTQDLYKSSLQVIIHRTAVSHSLSHGCSVSFHYLSATLCFGHGVSFPSFPPQSGGGERTLITPVEIELTLIFQRFLLQQWQFSVCLTEMFILCFFLHFIFSPERQKEKKRQSLRQNNRTTLQTKEQPWGDISRSHVAAHVNRHDLTVNISPTTAPATAGGQGPSGAPPSLPLPLTPTLVEGGREREREREGEIQREKEEPLNLHSETS